MTTETKRTDLLCPGCGAPTKLTPDGPGAWFYRCDNFACCWTTEGPTCLSREQAAKSYASGVILKQRADALAMLAEFLTWGRNYTSPVDPNSPHDILVRTHRLLASCDALAGGKEGTNGE